MDDLGEKKSDRRREGYAVVCVLLGAILLVAATLKAYQLATEPTAETGLMTSRWFLIGVVEFELLLGLCLVCGVFRDAVWFVTLGCFSVFGCVALYKALSGEVSCGCFGSVQVHPWYTFSLDSVAVVTLLRWRPEVRQFSGWIRETGPSWRLATVLTVWLLVGLPGAWSMTSFEAASVNAEGDFLGDGQIVVLEPETWVGKRFPLLGHVDIGDSLADGQWIVLLYHHDCPHCQDVLPHYELLAQATPDGPAATGVALSELPPFGSHGETTTAESPLHGRLAETKDWFVQTPTEIQLDRGTVISVRGAESLGHNSEYTKVQSEPWGTHAYIGFRVVCDTE